MSDRLSIMYVDDSAQDRELFRRIIHLMERSIHYIPVRHGIEALTYLKDGNYLLPDFIFLDLHMPGMNGIEVLQEIKKLEHAQHIPVFLYSVAHPESVEETARLLGAVDCLKKEDDLHNAREVVRKALLKFLGEAD
jgi:CheY-like chemotaxis protein